MYKCTCTLVGEAPISFSKVVSSAKRTGERPDDFEERTWRERLHVDANGEVFIPAPAIKNCLSDVAKYLGESVPGKGKVTFTRHIEAGVLVIDDAPLGVKASAVPCDRRFVPADGKRGSGKRVWRKFPIVEKWSAPVTIFIADPVLKPEKIEEYLRHAGKFIGLGRYRPRNNGTYGRFHVENFKSEAA